MNAENAKVQYEAGQDYQAMVALTDSGDHTIFNSTDTMFSNRSGYSPDVKPNGLATGGAVIPGVSGTAEKVDVAGLTGYLVGVLTTVAAGADTTVVRPAVDDHIINSITISSAGAIVVIQGAEGAGSFSETRGANGGPPWIPTTSFEIAQVRLDAQASAVITAAEIKSVPGTHTERYDYPVYNEVYARVESGVLGFAGTDFDAALPLNHSDDAGVNTSTKKVYASYYTPTFADVSETTDFVPPETSHSVTSTQIYGGTKASTSSSLSQGSFTAHLKDGISDGFLGLKNDTLWFRFYQDRYKAPYIITQGKFGVSRTFPAGDSITAACTISAENEALNVVA